MMRSFWILALCIAGLLSPRRAETAMVMPVNIEELTGRAHKIFVGTCTNVETKVNAQGIRVVEVTFSVKEGIKGDVGETVTFQQLSPQQQTPPASQQASQSYYRVNNIWEAAAKSVNLPTYATGETVLLFLARPGQMGITAPIGLLQGKLPISTSPTGGQVITNTTLKKTALKDSSLPDPGKTVEYERFLTALRTIVHPQQ